MGLGDGWRRVAAAASGLRRAPICSLLAVLLLAPLMVAPTQPQAKLVLRYGAEGGLFNQVGSHLTALSLAAYLKADVQWPPMHVHWPQHKEWSFGPSEWLFDMPRLNQTMAEKLDVRLLPTDWSAVDVAKAYAWTWPGHGPYPWRDGGVFKRLDLGRHVGSFDDAQAKLASGGALQGNTDIGWGFLTAAANTTQQARIFLTVVNALKFSTYVQELAATIVAALRANGAAFSAVHLRLEDDYGLGRDDTAFNQYVDVMRRAGMNDNTVLFVATGVTGDELVRLHDRLRAARVCRSIATIADYIAPAVLRTLTHELRWGTQFLVLADADFAVGHGVSALSYFMGQYRLLRNRTTDLVHHGNIASHFQARYSFPDLLAIARRRVQ